MVGCQTYEARVMAEEGRKMLSYIMLGAVESLLVSDDRSITFFMDDYNACSCRFHILITTVFLARVSSCLRMTSAD